ncbi:MAG: hypothetical protein RL685_2631 [Pseudomonadota bacterium]|jgi:hypothetical protein
MQQAQQLTFNTDNPTADETEQLGARLPVLAPAYAFTAISTWDAGVEGTVALDAAEIGVFAAE